MTLRPARRQLRLIFILLTAWPVAEIRAEACVGESAAPYPCSEDLAGVEIDWPSFRRHGRGSDNWPLTWADDDAQYTSWGDGHGWNRFRGEIRQRSFGISRLDGGPEDTAGHDIYQGAFKDCDADRITPQDGGRMCGKSYGMVALDSDVDGSDELYLWLSPGSGEDNLRSASLYYSRDHGHGWRYGGVRFGSSDGLVLPTFLQFGQSYSAITQAGLDPRYVYIYAIGKTRSHAVMHGLGIFKPGRIYLMRTPRTELGHKSAYEYFTGDDNKPWSTNPRLKAPVFVDQGGVGWNLSVSYAPSLGRYLLMTEHWVGFRGNLGLFESKNPWGPWRTVAYFSHWGKTTHAPARADADSAFFWNFSPKWSGKPSANDFVLVYTGVGEGADSYNVVRGRFRPPP